MLRNARHDKILELIEEMEIETQEELCDELSARNFAVTQATVSRDIKELHLFKVRGTKKRFRYAAISETEGGISEKMRILFSECVLNIRTVGNVIVIKTINANGGNAAYVVDRLDYKEVVGSVAGVDTVFSVCESPESSKIVANRLEAIVKG